MQGPRKIAVAGATGRVGGPIVDLLTQSGHDVVSISRANGVDLVTGEGLAAALEGVECVVDAASGPSPEEDAATSFFVTATRNLHDHGTRAGVDRMVVVSIIGTDRFTGGYGAAKIAHEQAHAAGPIPATIVRAAQFHEFVPQLVDWGTQGEISYVQNMRTQLVAARAVAEVLADVATGSGARSGDAPFIEVAGPREENLVDAATLLVARRGRPSKVEGVSDPDDPDRTVYEDGGLLPGADAILGGPTFEEWLTTTFP